MAGRMAGRAARLEEQPGALTNLGGVTILACPEMPSPGQGPRRSGGVLVSGDDIQQPGPDAIGLHLHQNVSIQAIPVG